MTNQSALRSAALATLVLASASLWVNAQDKKETPAPAPPPAASPQPRVTLRPDRPLPTGEAAKTDGGAQASQGLGAIGRVMPVGEQNLDVKIPSFKEGKPSSTLRADVMTRLDEENMTMEGMDIRLYGESHDKDVRIRLFTARYHMPSQILSSDQRSRVTRSDFDLQGDSMIFDTRTRQGTMTGNVRMVISDAGAFAPQKKDEDAPSPEGSKPAATDPTAASPPAATPPTSPSSPPANEKK